MLAIKTVFGDVHTIDRNVNEQLTNIETDPKTNEILDVQMKPLDHGTGRIAVMITYDREVS